MDDVEETLAALLPTVKFNDDDRQKFVDLLEVLGPEDPRTAGLASKSLTRPLPSPARSPRPESDAARGRRLHAAPPAAPGPRRALRADEVGVAGVVVDLVGEGAALALLSAVAG